MCAYVWRTPVRTVSNRLSLFNCCLRCLLVHKDLFDCPLLSALRKTGNESPRTQSKLVSSGRGVFASLDDTPDLQCPSFAGQGFLCRPSTGFTKFTNKRVQPGKPYSSNPYTLFSNFQFFVLRQDAAQALLGGLAVSAANNSNDNHHHHHNGASLQKVRGGGGGGVQDSPNTPGSNRKGHDEEQTLLSGVGNLMKRARRGVNSYFSALARQQKEIAREQRERHRKKSSNFDFLVDAEEGVGLLAIAGAESEASRGLEDGAGTNGGPLHRSQSAVFVPLRPQEEQADAPDPTTVLETRSSGVASDLGELRDVSEASAFLQGVDGSYGGAGGILQAGESTMKRGGRARLTTGDLVRLYREEEQWAGEDSAQDEDRERSRASKVSWLSCRECKDRDSFATYPSPRVCSGLHARSW